MEWVTTTTVLHDLRDFDNRSAWERFTQRFRSPVIGFAVRLGLREPEAEDVAQETLLAFADGFRRGSYHPDKGRLRDWLFGIAYRQVLKMRERLAHAEVQAPGSDTAGSFWSQLPTEKEATASWSEEWARAVLNQCLQQVRREVEPTTIRAFELFALAKQPAADVGTELGISRNAVFIAKHRILKRLRELQEQYEQVS
ncbi:MAG: sigma-70 family RNA polymerase sigma factor [Planctomycetes bacterium]|nr:sigma-70 family RNA polymerase sigma factor [Planctomycetota bacterium]